MSLPDGIRHFFRLGRARDIAADLDDELAFHFERKIEALTARGLAPDAAREEAQRQFGDLRAARAELLRVDLGDSAARRRRDWWEDLRTDLRHAVRSLSKTPGVTAAIILMLAVGVGANAAMLGILDRLLLRAPPHLVDPQGIVRVAVTSHFSNGGDYTRTNGPYIEIVDYSRALPGVAVAGYSRPMAVPFGTRDGDRVHKSSITNRFFEVLGTPALIGRTLDSSDAAGPPVAVISYGLWQREFVGDPAAVGRDIRIKGVPFRVAGVMPRGFSGAEANAADVWMLQEHDEKPYEWRTTRYTFWLEIIARVPAGADRVAAVQQITAARRAVVPDRPGRRIEEDIALGSIIPGRNSRRWDGVGVRLSVAVAVVSALLLLIAIANAANLLLVRAVSRTREYAVRTALGAGRGRLLRGVLTESVLLSLAGGGAAGAFGLVAARGLRVLLLPDYNWALPAIGLLPALFAALVSLVIGVLTGLVPAALAGRRETLGALRSGVQRGRGARGGIRRGLVALQVAVSVVLFVGTGLFARSFVLASNEDHGIDLRRMIEAEVDFEGDAAAQSARLTEVMDEVRKVPGVAGVTAITAAPMRRLDFSTITTDDRDSSIGAMNYAVPQDFLQVSGLAPRGGRTLAASDGPGSEAVAVVDDVLQSRLWPGGSAIGHCLRVEKNPACVRIVGVVAHVRATGLQDQPVPQFYRPLAQVPAPPEYALLVRAAGDPQAIVDPVARAIARIIPGYAPGRVKSYEEMLDPQIRPWRVGVILFSLAAGLALLLSSVGTYAVMAFAVRQRTHEFGVRRALGARAAHILGIVLREGAAVAGVGIVAGLAAVALAGNLVLPLLYKVAPRDPLVLGTAGVFLMAAALAAALGAGLLALRADPRQALQAD